MMKDMSDTIPTITFVDGRTFRTYKGVVIDITPNPVPESVQMILKQVGLGELEAYDVLNHPKGDDQVQASRILQRLFDAKSETGFHPDDDYEEILFAVCEDLAEEFL